MFDAGRRPSGRLFYSLVAVVMIAGSGRTAFGAAPVPQSGPATTTIADTVYLADGSRAQGSLIITWPAFLTVSGAAVAGGTTTTTLGTNGALSVALVPNAGATPAGMYYTVVYQLGPAEVRTEYWMVPTTSPANLAAVRTTPGSGVAAQPVSAQYVNSALATKANDNAVVHLSGTETISGAKTFAAAPSVPAPTSTGQVANKAYVDQSVSNLGSGNFLPTAGGTMTGPITLPASASYVTQLVGSLSNGGECSIASSTSLDFYPQYVPALNTLIVATYRGTGRAVAEVVNSASVVDLQNGADNGVRGIVRTMKTPSARTQADCENAALAILDDAGGPAWTGTYEIWSDFLPGGAADIFPGDALAVNVASRSAAFTAIVRSVSIDLVDLANDRGMYSIEFADDLAAPLALQDVSSATTVPLQGLPIRLSTSQVGSYYVASLTDAQITQVTSTSVQVDAGIVPGMVMASKCGRTIIAGGYRTTGICWGALALRRSVWHG